MDGRPRGRRDPLVQKPPIVTAEETATESNIVVDVRHVGPTDLDEHDPDVVAVDQSHSNLGGHRIQVVPATDHVLICAGELPSVCVPLADTNER